MSQLLEAKKTQWWECKVLKPKVSEKPFSGSLETHKKAWATVLPEGEVLMWQKGFPVTFKNTNEAGMFATCLKKCDNKAQLVINAWDRIMF